MLVVTVEVRPLGREDFKRKVAELRIVNDGTGTEEVGHYEVSWSEDSTLCLGSGRVLNHKRNTERGLIKLLKKACQSLLGE